MAVIQARILCLDVIMSSSLMLVKHIRLPSHRSGKITTNLWGSEACLITSSSLSGPMLCKNPECQRQLVYKAIPLSPAPVEVGLELFQNLHVLVARGHIRCIHLSPRQTHILPWSVHCRAADWTLPRRNWFSHPLLTMNHLLIRIPGLCFHNQVCCSFALLRSSVYDQTTAVLSDQ